MTSSPGMKTEQILAVDLGVKTGLALFDKGGRLLWCRSHNLGNMTRLRRAVHNILKDLPSLICLVLEGGGAVGEVWKREAKRQGIKVIEVSAEEWRGEFFSFDMQKDGRTAKKSALKLAGEIIKGSPSAYRKKLNHDTAEAVLIGLWAVRRLAES